MVHFTYLLRLTIFKLFNKFISMNTVGDDSECNSYRIESLRRTQLDIRQWLAGGCLLTGF